jgi:hypothetical protein
MTEQQREDELLAELLDLPGGDGESTVGSIEYVAAHRAAGALEPLLTRREERALLKAANEVGTPTLAPQARPQDASDARASFVNEIVGVVRRYPIPMLLAGAGLAFLLTRRRH